MKHEAILAGEQLLPRDPRVDTELPVRVHCEAGEFEAELTNLSSDGFRLHSDGPLQVEATQRSKKMALTLRLPPFDLAWLQSKASAKSPCRPF